MNKFCQHCNQSNPSEAAFCLNCASPLLQGQFGGGQQANNQWNQANVGGQQMKGSFTRPFGDTTGASQRAKIACALAFVGLVCCGPFTTIPAAIVGWIEIDAINKGQSPPSGKLLASFGLWGGILFTVFQVGAFLLWMLFAAASVSSDSYNY